MSIEGKRIAILAADNFEDVELAGPRDQLAEAGADITIVGEEAGETYTGKRGKVAVTADVAADDVTADDFDALVIPGGKAPETMRQNQAMVSLAQDMMAADKTVAAICHGPQVLASAGVLRGRKATAWPGIIDDVQNAGATPYDEPVVVDRNLITSRKPDDIPQFVEAIIDALSS